MNPLKTPHKETNVSFDEKLSCSLESIYTYALTYIYLFYHSSTITLKNKYRFVLITIYISELNEYLCYDELLNIYKFIEIIALNVP